jgi:flagellar motor component MotA
MGVGSAVFFCFTGFLFNGGHLADLIHPGEMVIVLFIPLGLIAASFGFSGLLECIGLPVKLFQSKTLSTETAQIYHYWIKTTCLLRRICGSLEVLVALQGYDKEQLAV